MVLTRSQRPSRGGSSDPEPTIQKTESSKKTRRAKSKAVPIPAESSISPISDSTTPPLDSSSQSASDKDAVVDMATEDLSITESGSPGNCTSKGKRSRRRRSRKRKLAAENEAGVTGDSSEMSETTAPSSSISSSSTAPNLQEKANKEGDRQDQHRDNLEPSAKKTSVNHNQSQKDNVNSTTEQGPDAGTVDVEKGSDELQQMQPEDAKKILQLYKKESFVEGQAAKPKGQPKSGRPWKTEQTSRFSGMKQDRPLRTSWEKKMQQKAEMKNLKTFEAELKEAWNSEQERKKQHRAKKIKRKLENQRKSEIVQMISNPAKIKRMKRKQLRRIETRAMPDDSVKQVFPS